MFTPRASRECISPPQQGGHGPWALVPMAPMAPKGVLDGGSRMPVARSCPDSPWHPLSGGPNTAARRLRRGKAPPWPPMFFHVIILRDYRFFFEIRPIEEVQGSNSSPRREEVGRRTLRDYGGFLPAFFYRAKFQLFTQQTSRRTRFFHS